MKMIVFHITRWAVGGYDHRPKRRPASRSRLPRLREEHAFAPMIWRLA